MTALKHFCLFPYKVCSFNVEKDKIEEHTAMCTSTKHQSSEDQRLNVPKDESNLNAGTAATLVDLSAEKRDKGKKLNFETFLVF